MSTTEITLIIEQASTLAITSPESLSQASEYRTQAKAFLKALTTEKESLTKPINASLNAIRDKYRTREDLAKAIIEALDEKMSQYQTALKKAQAEATEAITARVAPGRGHLSAETAVARLEALPEVATTVSTSSGGTQFTTKPVFQVTDMHALPMFLHLPDLVTIRTDMLAGIRHPGVEYSTEERPRNVRTK